MLEGQQAGKLAPLQLTPPKHPRVPPGALRGCRGEAPLRLGGAQRGERRAPKGGLPPLAEVPHQRGILVRNSWCGTSTLGCWEARTRFERPKFQHPSLPTF